jgi:hypothetical protein
LLRLRRGYVRTIGAANVKQKLRIRNRLSVIFSFRPYDLHSIRNAP